MVVDHNLQSTLREALTRSTSTSTDPVDGHNYSFPEQCRDIIAKTEICCNVFCFNQHDEKFMTFNEAISKIYECVLAEVMSIPIKMKRR